MKNVGFMAAPNLFKERKRCAEVQQYLKLEHWHDDEALSRFSNLVRTSMKTEGVGISLISKAKVIYKYERRLNLCEIPRSVLIDGHCILSNYPLVFLDASQDWRTKNNPLVNGFPYVRFYCGVHLKTPENHIIGVLSIFDTRSKTEFTQESIDRLCNYAQDLMKFLNIHYENVKVQNTKGLRDSDHKFTGTDQLAKKLGRATSRGNNITLFEKDGSGSAYTSNLSSSKFFQFKRVTDSTISSTEKFKLINKMYRAKSMKDASVLLCESIKEGENVDFVGIYEVKLSVTFEVSQAHIQSQIALTRELLHSLQQTTKTAPVNNFQVRFLGLTDGIELQVSQEYLKAAFDSDYGIRYMDATSALVFSHGIFTSFRRSEPYPISRARQGFMNDTQEVCIRSDGLILFALNKLGSPRIRQQTVSRIFDHARVLHEIYT